MAKSPENGEPGGPGGPGGPLIDSPCRFRTNLDRGRCAQSAFISQLLLLSLLQFGGEPRRVTNEEVVVKACSSNGPLDPCADTQPSQCSPDRFVIITIEKN